MQRKGGREGDAMMCFDGWPGTGSARRSRRQQQRRVCEFASEKKAGMDLDKADQSRRDVVTGACCSALVLRILWFFPFALSRFTHTLTRVRREASRQAERQACGEAGVGMAVALCRSDEKLMKAKRRRERDTPKRESESDCRCPCICVQAIDRRK